MSLDELLPVVRDLPHGDKLCLLQFLARALARDEGLPDIGPGTEFAIWSPYDAFAAAATLQHALDSGESST